MKRLLVSSFLITVLLLSLWAAAAFAGTAYGGWTTATINNKTFSNRSHVVTNTWAYAYQQQKCTNGSAPAGYMGNNARIYYSSGNLRTSTGIRYNASTYAANSVYLVGRSYDAAPGSSFYSRGEALQWDKSRGSYWYTYVSKSPNQTCNWWDPPKTRRNQ